MVRAPMTLLGVAGFAFLAGGLVPASFFPGSRADVPANPGSLMGQVSVSSKSDRLARPVQASVLKAVSIVELLGADKTVVIFRGSKGEVLYRSDSQSGTTLFSKDTDLPVITFNQAPPSPPQPAVTGQEQGETPRNTKEKRRNPVGCLGDLSPLAKAGAGRSPSLCLASLAHPLS